MQFIIKNYKDNFLLNISFKYKVFLILKTIFLTGKRYLKKVIIIYLQCFFIFNSLYVIFSYFKKQNYQF